MARIKQITHIEISAAKFDDEPIRNSLVWQVSYKVGFDKVTFEVPEGIVEQTQNALEAVDRCFQKANLSIANTYHMIVMLGEMTDKKIVSDCIREKFSASPKSLRSPKVLEEMKFVTFYRAKFAAPEIRVMIRADEYHGR